MHMVWAAALAAILSSSGLAEDHHKRKHSDISNIGNRNINEGSLNFVSIDQEIALGQRFAKEVESQSRLLKDSEIFEYVNTVAQRLVRNSDSRVPFTVKVIDSEEVNAVALPGGFFYLNTGLIVAADDEAELAGVMAHEIAHVTARHATEQRSKTQLWNILSIPLVFLGGPIGYGIRQAAGVLVPLSFLRFSRKAEEEADFFAIQYLDKTGYDPGAMLRFFEKLQAKEQAKPDSVSSLFSTHPPTRTRIRLVKETIQHALAPHEEYVETTSEFDRIKRRLIRFQNARRPEDENKPTLRRKTTR